MKESTETARHLFGIAEAQQGFFTAKQAKAVGYFEESMVYHVKAGNWIRDHRGIYRLSKYPATATKNRRGFTRMKQHLRSTN